MSVISRSNPISVCAWNVCLFAGLPIYRSGLPFSKTSTKAMSLSFTPSMSSQPWAFWTSQKVWTICHCWQALAAPTIIGMSGEARRLTWGRSAQVCSEMLHTLSNSTNSHFRSVSVSKFPNLFLLAGPNTLPSSNSTLRGIECSIVYITRVLRGLWARNPSQQSQARLEIAPSPSAQAMFNAELQRKMRALVYTQQVNTWYIGKDSGKNTLIWPGTQISFWFSRCVRPVKWSDWVISR